MRVQYPVHADASERRGIARRDSKRIKEDRGVRCAVGGLQHIDSQRRAHHNRLGKKRAQFGIRQHQRNGKRPRRLSDHRDRVGIAPEVRRDLADELQGGDLVAQRQVGGRDPVDRQIPEHPEPVGNVDHGRAAVARQLCAVIAGQRSASGHEGPAMEEDHDRCILRLFRLPDV